MGERLGQSQAGCGKREAGCGLRVAGWRAGGSRVAGCSRRHGACCTSTYCTVRSSKYRRRLLCVEKRRTEAELILEGGTRWSSAASWGSPVQISTRRKSQGPKRGIGPGNKMLHPGVETPVASAESPVAMRPKSRESGQSRETRLNHPCSKHVEASKMDDWQQRSPPSVGLVHVELSRPDELLTPCGKLGTPPSGIRQRHTICQLPLGLRGRRPSIPPVDSPVTPGPPLPDQDQPGTSRFAALQGWVPRDYSTLWR